jgi:hypothetical protein
MIMKLPQPFTKHLASDLSIRDPTWPRRDQKRGGRSQSTEFRGVKKRTGQVLIPN